MLSMGVRATEGRAGFAGNPPYRLLEWHEVQALAEADGIGFEQDGEQVRLTVAFSAA